MERKAVNANSTTNKINSIIHSSYVMPYSIENIATLIGARKIGSQPAEIDWLLTDSRSLAFPETTLFFALRTKLGDGHQYIADLYRRGVRNFVVGTLPASHDTVFPDANFLLVVSPLKALQRLAERHREEFSQIPVIGVTGSNGKTVVKEWLYQLLSPSKHVTRSPRSYNSQVGVPLSVWLLDAHTQVGIFEAGISQPDEMQALRAMIQPTIGVMTNIGPAHQENFATIEEKCHEKLSLFKDAQVIVYCADDPVVSECVCTSLYTGDLLAWSTSDPQRALYINSIDKTECRTHIVYTYLGRQNQLCIPFTDEASITNCLHCLAVCLYLHVPETDIAARMEQLEPVAMRLEVIQGMRNCTLINDTYNSDVASLDIALDFMNRRPEQQKSKTLILSDILQTGLDVNELYGKVAEMIERRGIDHLIGVGPEISSAHSLFKLKKTFFASSRDLLDSGLLNTLSNERVLIKGSRQFGFEELTAALSLRAHETTLDVNLEAIAENLNFYRSFMKPETKITCMVKASAYGAGAVEIAKTLQDRGVDYLAVAVADEGTELRRSGITAGIIVMNPEISAFNTLFAYDLEPEVYSFKLLDSLIRAAEKEGIQSMPVHIKLDTGMHRLGFNPLTDIPVLIDRLHHQTAVIPRSVFSHFVGSDSPDFDEFSARQFKLFDEASKSLQAAFPHKILRHICNSAGIERFPERHLDMVRLGLGLYGIDPIDNRRLHNATSLRTTILQIREVPKGDSIGYSRKTTVDRDSRIAAIPIGYADGLNRHLGNRRGYCLVNGYKANYMGNICMDVCMIDVTDIPCHEGDTVEIFGDNLPVTVLSDLLDTIPYEVLTSVSNRVKRVYFQ